MKESRMLKRKAYKAMVDLWLVKQSQGSKLQFEAQHPKTKELLNKAIEAIQEFQNNIDNFNM